MKRFLIEAFDSNQELEDRANELMTRGVPHQVADGSSRGVRYELISISDTNRCITGAFRVVAGTVAIEVAKEFDPPPPRVDSLTITLSRLAVGSHFPMATRDDARKFLAQLRQTWRVKGEMLLSVDEAEPITEDEFVDTYPYPPRETT